MTITKENVRKALTTLLHMCSVNSPTLAPITVTIIISRISSSDFLLGFSFLFDLDFLDYIYSS